MVGARLHVGDDVVMLLIVDDLFDSSIDASVAGTLWSNASTGEDNDDVFVDKLGVDVDDGVDFAKTNIVVDIVELCVVVGTFVVNILGAGCRWGVGRGDSLCIYVSNWRDTEKHLMFTNSQCLH